MPTLSFTQFWEDESAQDLVEYALVAACIALGTLTGVHGLAGSLANYMNIVLGAFNGALAGHI
ncbi:MAG TPA: Flp family type IVb pilin [Acidobacteriaceae bacterium]